jgi:hypothetical protein
MNQFCTIAKTILELLSEICFQAVARTENWPFYRSQSETAFQSNGGD